MNFYYCQSCFKKTPQTSSIVTCCSHCGKYFVDTSINNVTFTGGSTSIPEIGSREYKQQLINRAEKQRRIRREVEMDIIDDDLETDAEDDGVDDENISVPNINKLKVEVEIPENSGIPVRSLAKGVARQQKVKLKGKQIKIDKKQFLADFQKSASTLRKG